MTNWLKRLKNVPTIWRALTVLLILNGQIIVFRTIENGIHWSGRTRCGVRPEVTTLRYFAREIMHLGTIREGDYGNLGIRSRKEPTTKLDLSPR